MLASNQVSNYHRRQRRTPADADGRYFPGHAYRGAVIMRLQGPVPAPGQTGGDGTGMGMIGAYARMTPGELDRALKDPEWAVQRIEDLEESTYPGQDSAATDRYVDIDKAWNGIWFLLNAAGAPVDVVGGGTPLSDEDLGYGPARRLSPDEVGLAAASLAALPREELAGRFDPEQMNADGIYPAIWDGVDALDYLRVNYAVLVTLSSGSPRTRTGRGPRSRSAISCWTSAITPRTSGSWSATGPGSSPHRLMLPWPAPVSRP